VALKHYKAYYLHISMKYYCGELQDICVPLKLLFFFKTPIFL